MAHHVISQQTATAHLMEAPQPPHSLHLYPGNERSSTSESHLTANI